ncbi:MULTISPECIES: DUF4132 domain-containing protein [Rhodococcus]|uniref:DUF4132 domain-containing protein n=1 Tax=Rhodococcus cercidiphylli TaxID=489916 RepID=A0ABU4B169_9NOCA|nr:MULTISPECIES: DUF4132 domain-containing protein [Rhodococcus]MDV6232242.1 DUF4132 domain-containing protein [Rhodococcus cercidiphylli]MDV7990371.1 DUF4132 domain-containing protein [Rhodococcus sp. IEGM 1374]
MDESTNESAFAPHATWLPMKYPRHGGFRTHVEPVSPDAGTVLREAVETNDEYVRWTTRYLDADPDPSPLALAARDYRAGTHTPVGAAVFAFLLGRFLNHHEVPHTVFVDGWVARHGLVFATEALMEYSDTKFVYVTVPVSELPPDTMIMVSRIGHTDDSVPVELPRYVQQERLAQSDSTDEQIRYSAREEVLDRMRGLLAVASDQEYAAARDAVAPLRTNTVRQLTASYLFPTEKDWSRQLISGADAPHYHWISQLITSSNSAAELKRIAAPYGQESWIRDDATVAAVVEGVGTELTPMLTELLDAPERYRYVQDDAIPMRLLQALSAIPSDDAFSALAARSSMKGALPAVVHAMRHYPRRAMRLLAGQNSSLFDRHVRQNPELAIEMAPTLPETEQRRITELTAEVPEATDLPEILVNPPWTRKHKANPPNVFPGIATPDIRKIEWLPGEREELQNSRREYYTWETFKRSYVPDTNPATVRDFVAQYIFVLAPDDVARPLLTDWPGTTLKEPLRVVARFELDALPMMLRFARAHPGAAAPYLMPYVDIDVARLQATAFATRKNLRKPSLAWLVRHADDAAALLVPDALGKPGKQRDHATTALRALARATSRETVLGATTKYGQDEVDAIAAIVDLDPLEVLPKRIPKIPEWVDTPTLPTVLTADRSAKLPVSAMNHMLTMCAISTVDAPYAGLDLAAAHCDRRSLGTAVWAVFERWWGNGAPSKENWSILALGWLGDDTAVTRLAPLIRQWPGENGTARAQLGLDALAAHGSTRALTELDHISRKMKFKSLKNGAKERVAELAESLGLDHEQLADRIVPDLDLTPEGTMSLSYGPRSFTVGFTEALVPFVLDENGKKTAGLPKPTTRDDPISAEDAKKRFANLKREVKSVAAEQIKRFNRSMVTGRRWTNDEFTRFVLGNPLLIHIARRLLWGEFGTGPHPTTVFRISEDNSPADVDDNAVTLGDGTIGLVHPAHIPDTVGAWSDVFADYEILQPFPQLGRPVHDPLPGDVDGSGLARFTGVTATPSQALRLTYRGWEPVWENPASWGQGLLYRLSDDVSVLLGLEPGMGTGDPYNGYPDQKLVSVDLRGGTLGDVDRATVSELIADLAGFAS